VVAASDLHPTHRPNAMTKFADNTYLLVGSRSIGMNTITSRNWNGTDEYDNIKK